jgi:hypothetical protein
MTNLPPNRFLGSSQGSEETSQTDVPQGGTGKAFSIEDAIREGVAAELARRDAERLIQHAHEQRDRPSTANNAVAQVDEKPPEPTVHDELVRLADHFPRLAEWLSGVLKFHRPD